MSIENILIALVIVGGVWAFTQNRKKDKERKEFNERETPKPAPSIADLPVGNYCIIDECTPEIAAGRETNGAQDVQAQLYLLISETGTKPAFIGVSCGEHGVNKQPTINAIKELRLNIPVLEGAPTYAGAKSELSDAIVAESKKGVFKIYLGSPAGDVARAFKDDGIHIHNIRLPRLLEHTWNEHINYVAAKYVLDRLQDKSGAVTEYYELIKRSNLPSKFQDTHTFINLNRTLKAWDLANSPEILKRNQELNAGIRDNTGVLRIADVLCVAKDLGFEKDIARIFNGIQNGMDICKDRIALGAVETLVQSTPPLSSLDMTPINRDTFNESNCKVYGGTRNPFRYKKTSTIQSASIGINSHTIRHTKAGTWAGKTYQAGRKIDGTHGIVSYDRETKQWYVFMFEYSVIGEPRRPKGWQFLNWIQQGDPVGLIASTNTRSSEWDVRGQANERTNIYWVTA